MNRAAESGWRKRPPDAWSRFKFMITNLKWAHVLPGRHPVPLWSVHFPIMLNDCLMPSPFSPNLHPLLPWTPSLLSSLGKQKTQRISCSFHHIRPPSWPAVLSRLLSRSAHRFLPSVYGQVTAESCPHSFFQLLSIFLLNLLQSSLYAQHPKTALRKFSRDLDVMNLTM